MALRAYARDVHMQVIDFEEFVEVMAIDDVGEQAPEEVCVLQVLVRTRCDTPRSDVLTPLSDDVTSDSRVLSCAVIRGGFN